MGWYSCVVGPCSLQPQTGRRPHAQGQKQAFISFLYLKKIKFQKYMSVLQNFKNIPRSPYGGRQALNVIFFFKFATRSLAGGARVQGGPVAPPSGDWWATSTGRPGLALLYKHSIPIPSSFEPKNSTKNPEKKRGVRRREAAKLCRIAHL